MSGSIWLPGVIVLVAGLAGGLLLARRLGRRSRQSPSQADLRLRIADLEARRDELYRRLRELSPGTAESGERESLEIAAARALRDLDAARAGLEERRPAAAEPSPAREPPPPRRYAGVVGFLGGAAAVGLISLLIYFAGRDAKPDPGSAERPLPTDHPEITEGLPPEMSERLGALAGRLEADPEDLMARKELALLQLSAGSYMESYRQAEEILKRVPEDPDGLFVQGVVRVAMGNNEIAVDLLDRVLARYPEHLQALLYRGIALYQAGEPDRAVDTWELGLEIAGGSQPEFERLLLLASQQQGAPAAAPEPAAAPPATAGPTYRLRVELAPGVEVDPAAVLFVSVRPGTTGPPALARRIGGPRFPLEVELGPDDSMMGAAFPESGTVSVRLDADGNASTRDDRDLFAEETGRPGSDVVLVLGGPP